MEKKIELFVETLKNKFDARYEVKKGKKYFKVLVVLGEDLILHYVYCFIDMEGNIYTPANYNTPKKNVIANIDNIFDTNFCRKTYCKKY